VLFDTDRDSDPDSDTDADGLLFAAIFEAETISRMMAAVWVPGPSFLFRSK
jgi:hypothetical protein